MWRGLLLIILAKAICPSTSAAQQWSQACFTDRDSLERTLSAMPLDEIEGVWQFNGGGEVLISKSAGNGYDLISLDAPDRRIMPGTVIGTIRQTAVPHKFDAAVSTSYKSVANPRQWKKFVIEADHSGNFLSFKKVKGKVKVNLWRLIPYMFRGVVAPATDTREGLDGLYRVYPRHYGPGLKKRWL